MCIIFFATSCWLGSLIVVWGPNENFRLWSSPEWSILWDWIILSGSLKAFLNAYNCAYFNMFNEIYKQSLSSRVIPQKCGKQSIALIITWVFLWYPWYAYGKQLIICNPFLVLQVSFCNERGISGTFLNNYLVIQYYVYIGIYFRKLML